MQRGLRVITLQGETEKSPILLSQYWKNDRLDGTIIITHFDGSNNILVDCIFLFGSGLAEPLPKVCLIIRVIYIEEHCLSYY